MNLNFVPGFGGSQRGFTLVELIIAIVVLSILSVYAMMNSGPSPAEMTLPAQARQLASDIRYAQTLAFTSGSRMRLTITAGANGSYTAACVSTGCSTGNNFSVTLQKGVILGGSPTALEFNTLGEPEVSLGVPQSASYTLGSEGSAVTVSVAALTGFVTVSSP